MDPTVIWLTGLSGSGKTTLGERLTEELCSRGHRVEYLDGDVLRNLFPTTGFSRAERDAHIQRVGFMASRLESHGVFVVAAFISPYRDARGWVRKLCRRFVEVHVSTPLEVCEARDVKGLYARARRGEISNFTGVSSFYEAPERPEVVVDTSVLDLEEAVTKVLGSLGV